MTFKTSLIMQTINILAAGLFFAGPTFWSAILLFELFHITFVKISSVNCRAFLALFSPFFTYLLSQQIDTGPRHLKPAVIYSPVACGITRSPTHTQTTPPTTRCCFKQHVTGAPCWPAVVLQDTYSN